MVFKLEHPVNNAYVNVLQHIKFLAVHSITTKDLHNKEDVGEWVGRLFEYWYHIPLKYEIINCGTRCRRTDHKKKIYENENIRTVSAMQRQLLSSVEIAVSIFGSDLFYHAQLLSNIMYLQDLNLAAPSRKFFWVLYMDDSVSAELTSMYSKFPEVRCIKEDIPHQKNHMGTLWRFQSLWTSPCDIVCILDADQILFDLIKSDWFPYFCTSFKRPHSLPQVLFTNPPYNHVLYRPMVQAGFILIQNPKEKAFSTIMKMNYKPFSDVVVMEYIRLQQSLNDRVSRMRGYSYGIDELFLTMFMFPHVTIPMTRPTISERQNVAVASLSDLSVTRKSDRLLWKKMYRRANIENIFNGKFGDVFRSYSKYNNSYPTMLLIEKTTKQNFIPLSYFYNLLR